MSNHRVGAGLPRPSAISIVPQVSHTRLASQSVEEISGESKTLLLKADGFRQPITDN